MAEPHTPPPTDAVSHNGAATDTEEGHAAPGHAEMVGAADDHGAGHAEPTALFLDASGWVALAMIAVFVLMWWKGVHKAIQEKVGAAEARLRAATDAALADIENVAAEAAQEVVARLAGLSVSRDEAAQAVKAATAHG